MKTSTPNTDIKAQVAGMSCAACAISVEKALRKTQGVRDANVNFANHSVNIQLNDSSVDLLLIKRAVQSAGYELILPTTSTQSKRDIGAENLDIARKRAIATSLLATPVFILGMFFMHWKWTSWISMVLCIPVLFVFGGHFFQNAWKLLKLGKANMDTLVALSTGIAFLYSIIATVFSQWWIDSKLENHVYFEAAAVVIAFISIGKWLEERAKSASSVAIKKLAGMQSGTAILLENGKERIINISEISKGMRLRIRPGDRIPVDGSIVDGYAHIDESLMSGEPLPVYKQMGDRILAGTLNQNGSLQIISEQVGEDTILSEMIRLVEQAQGSKAAVQRLADKIASVFVPVVLGVSILTFTIWMILGGFDHLSHGITAAISVLVIACPCALGLATPTALMVGMGRAAQNHILIRDANSLELACKVDTLVLDKTGTLTEGRPFVLSLDWINDLNPIIPDLIYSLVSLSSHPLSVALANRLQEDGRKLIKLDSFKDIPGSGMTADHELGLLRAGSLAWMKKEDISIPNEFQIVLNENRNDSLVCCSLRDRMVAIVIIGDTLKYGSSDAIAELRALGIALHVLSGDRQMAVASVAKELGIVNYRGDLSPKDKGQVIRELRSKGSIVAMAGDGINDLEALALADVSIAMGKGTDIAMDVAQMTLIGSDLRLIPKAIKLSKLTIRGIKQNLFWAFLYNVIGIPIAAGILFPLNEFLLNPMLAGAAMALSSVSVVLNSLRLRFVKL